MGDLKVGNKTVKNVMVGTTQVKEVWIGKSGGADLIWKNQPDAPGSPTTSVSL